jgi:hypothetical protein
VQQDAKAVNGGKPIPDRKRRQIKTVWCLCLLLSVILLLHVPANAAVPGAKRVVILHSFGSDFRPWGEYARAIRSELTRQSRWPLDIQDHSLVTARSSDENPEIPFVEYLSALYSTHRPDLIICIGASGLRTSPRTTPWCRYAMILRHRYSRSFAFCRAPRISS